jgi:hypothetical protein
MRKKYANQPVNISMHEHYPEHERLVRLWLNDQRWPVSDTHYDFDRSVLAWRHEEGDRNLTLRISRRVLEPVMNYDMRAATARPSRMPMKARKCSPARVSGKRS